MSSNNDVINVLAESSIGNDKSQWVILTYDDNRQNQLFFTLVATHFRSTKIHLRGNLSLHFLCMLFD